MLKMITRNQAKLILSLQKRKVREENSLFVIEGDKMVRAHAYVPAPSRLRRVAVEQGKHIGRADTARTVAANRARLKNTFATDVAEVRVFDHPLAPLHSWQPGDELRLVGDAGWAGELDQWVRVMSTTYEPDAFEAGATLTVTRADRT